jgi:hypothetical protein
MPRTAAILLALTLALVAAAAASARAVTFEPVADDVAGPLIADDDERFAAFMLDARTVRVLGGEGFDAPVPASCADPVAVVDVGGGQALVDCEGAGDPRWHGRPLLLDLTTAVWHEPPGVARLLERVREGEQVAGFTEVGRHWLGGEVSDHFAHPIWVEWHTGVYRDEEGDAAHVPDLDAEDLYVPLCRPLLRRSAGDQGEARFAPFRYRRPYALDGLVMRRCGSSWSLRLDADPGMHFGWNTVTWTRGAGVHSDDLWCGVRFSWSVPQRPQAVARAGGFVYVTTRSGRALRVERVVIPFCPEVTRPRAVRVSAHGATRVAKLTTWTPRFRAGSPQLLPPVLPSPRPLRVRAGDTVTVRAACAPKGVRWQVGAGRWRDAREAGFRLWRFQAPTVSEPAQLSVETRCLFGRARYRVPLS